MSAHPRGMDLNPDNIEAEGAPLVCVRLNGDLLVKPAESGHWIRITPFGDVKWIPSASLVNVTWLIPGGST